MKRVGRGKTEKCVFVHQRKRKFFRAAQGYTKGKGKDEGEGPETTRSKSIHQRGTKWRIGKLKPQSARGGRTITHQEEDHCREKKTMRQQKGRKADNFVKEIATISRVLENIWVKGRGGGGVSPTVGLNEEIAYSHSYQYFFVTQKGD